MNTETIFGAISLAISAAAMIVAWRKGRAERSNLDADTAGKYQELANKAAEREATMMDRVETLEEVVKDMESQLAKQQKELDALRDWSKRLAAQVVSMGGTPVQMKTVVENG